MITRSKHPAILTTALMLGAGLAACGSDETKSAGGKTTITFWDDNGGPASPTTVSTGSAFLGGRHTDPGRQVLPANDG